MVMIAGRCRTLQQNVSKSMKGLTDVKPVTMKIGKPANEGVCPDCGTKIFKIGAAK
jgi:hypothetical protein